jgi:hypothetical protein
MCGYLHSWDQSLLAVSLKRSKSDISKWHLLWAQERQSCDPGFPGGLEMMSQREAAGLCLTAELWLR